MMNRQIGVGNLNMGSLATPYLKVMKGSRDLLLKFADSLHIFWISEARNNAYWSRGTL